MTDDQEPWEEYKKGAKPLGKPKQILKNQPKTRPKKVVTQQTSDLWLSNDSWINSSYIGASIPNVSKKEQRKIYKTNIERQIDLHSMTLELAKNELIRFIMRAYQDQVRCVLVICGKGSYENHEYQGKIRKELNVWLKSLKAQQIIATYTYAEQSQGGEGAVRVILKP